MENQIDKDLKNIVDNLIYNTPIDKLIAEINEIENNNTIERYEVTITITEWFARAVAAGLMPEWENIMANWNPVWDEWNVDNGHWDGGSTFVSFTIVGMPPANNYSETIQLRSNDKDLYELKWRKPTEIDIGKMCWFNTTLGMVCAPLAAVSRFACNFYHYHISENLGNYDAQFCLLADHNQIAPTKEDFKRIYGADNGKTVT